MTVFLMGESWVAQPANERDVDSIPGSRRSPRVGSSNPLQYSCLGNPMDRGACWATFHGVTKVRQQLATSQKQQQQQQQLSS